MKRFLTMLLFTCILLGAHLTVNAFAVEPENDDLVYAGIIEETYENNSGAAYDYLDTYVNMTSFRATLDTNFKALKTEFDISSYYIPTSAANVLGFYIYKEIPENFHVDQLGYYYNSNGYITSLTVTYKYTKTQYNNLLSQCRTVAQKMISGLEDVDDLSKALVIHDRLALHTAYDTSISKSNIYDMVGVFVNETAVCEGYAKAYSYMMDLVGIRSYVVTSDLLKHAWNIVYIDGVKYHVDVTWDDPTEDRFGRVYHNNFLRSSEGMVETGHYKDGYYDFDDSPVDTTYDDAFWQESYAAIEYVSGKFYFINTTSNGQQLISAVNDDVEYIVDVTSEYTTSAGYWGKNFAMLASDGVDVLISTPNAIYRYCTLSGTVEKIWSPSIPSGTAIFGFVYKDGYLVCVPHTTPNFTANTNLTKQMKKAYSAHSHAHTHTYDNACDADCNLCGAYRSTSHTYSNACDATCNVCGATRSVPAHVYDNACDTACNVCGAVRSTTHTYDNPCDPDCNVCGAVRSTSHAYDNACDPDCNKCGTTRSASHTYDHACDKNCNVCGATRTTSHYTVVTFPATPHTVNNDSAYPFVQAGEWTVSTNKTKSTTSTYTLTAKHDCTLTLKYKVSSEAKYDKLTVKKNSTTLDTISGEVEKSLTVTMTTGDTLTVSYSKDSRTDKGSDCAYFSYSCSCTVDREILSVSLNPTCTEPVVCSRCNAVVHTANGHAYDNACDESCNRCGAIRTVPDHVYTGVCDGACNNCGYTRTPPHAYTDANDLTCNLCGHTRPAFIKGDVNDNRVLDMDDAIYLLFNVNFASAYPINQPADFDGNGRVDMDDAIYLLFHINFSDAYPLH